MNIRFYSSTTRHVHIHYFIIIGYRFATLLALLKETVQLPAKYRCLPSFVASHGCQAFNMWCERINPADANSGVSAVHSHNLDVDIRLKKLQSLQYPVEIKYCCFIIGSIIYLYIVLGSFISCI
jgi:hypothetical protein